MIINHISEADKFKTKFYILESDVNYVEIKSFADELKNQFEIFTKYRGWNINFPILDEVIYYQTSETIQKNFLGFTLNYKKHKTTVYFGFINELTKEQLDMYRILILGWTTFSCFKQSVTV